VCYAVSEERGCGGSGDWWASTASAVVVPGALAAPAYTWRSVKVGGGGFIPGIVFSRVEKGLAYCGRTWAAHTGGTRSSASGFHFRTDNPNRFHGTESIAPTRSMSCLADATRLRLLRLLELQELGWGSLGQVLHSPSNGGRGTSRRWRCRAGDPAPRR